MPADATLHYFHDPMCSWCWGFRPVSGQLFLHLPAGVRLRKTVGGLAPDSDIPMPPGLQEKLQATWHRIHDQLGTEFNFDFWTTAKPRRSTYPACRAVLAAEQQGRYDDMVYAIQQAYYLRAMNPSDTLTLEALAAELALDATAFASDLRSEHIEARLQKEIAFYRAYSSSGFPSLVLEREGERADITLDYQDHRPMIKQILGLRS